MIYYIFFLANSYLNNTHSIEIDGQSGQINKSRHRNLILDNLGNISSRKNKGNESGNNSESIFIFTCEKEELLQKWNVVLNYFINK